MTIPTPQAQVTEEMVERGARALHSDWNIQTHGFDKDDWDTLDAWQHDRLRTQARCVLESALSAPPARQDVVAEIDAERQRQISQEGWTPEHDDNHDKGELAQAACCYTMGRTGFGGAYDPEHLWPVGWHYDWWKPGKYRRNLVKAAALIVAEIERLDRAAQAVANVRGEKP